MMIRKLASGEYRIYADAKNPKTGHRRNLGTFPTREAAKKHVADIAISRNAADVAQAYSGKRRCSAARDDRRIGGEEQGLFCRCRRRTLPLRPRSHLAINKRKEVIRCLMVQQWGRFSSFGGSASELARSAGEYPLPVNGGSLIDEAPWSPGLELSGR